MALEVIEMGRDYIDETATRMAFDLDNGGGDLVARKLRDDSLRMPESEFARLVYLTENYERKGRGDDLSIQQRAGGEVVTVDKYQGQDRYGTPRYQSLRAGEIVFDDIYDQTNPPRPGIDKRSAIIGGIIGAVAGAVIKHQIDDHRDNRRNDNHRNDSHRDRDRDNDRNHRDHDRDDRRHHHGNDNRRR